MSAHVLLNLLNSLGKTDKMLSEFIKLVGEKDKMRGFSKHLISFPNEFNKLNNTGAITQDSIYCMTL